MFALLLSEVTLWELVSEIPHDFGAAVVYLVLALFIAGIWYGSRSKTEEPAGE